MFREDFSDLTTVKFQVKMKPAALEIYKKVFPGCNLEDLRGNGFKVHILDKEFGIDALLNMKSGQWFSIQEKYRKNYFLKFGDFTQEFMNATGSNNESPGEWFKLGAQLYFYGWANTNETDFEKWCIIDIPRYKLLVEQAGGLNKIGTLKVNKLHGRSSFYTIPIQRLFSCFVADHRGYRKK